LEFDAADQLASAALAIATSVGDRWAMGWALNTLAYATGMRGQPEAALDAFERGLDVTREDPALSDLRLLLMYNRAEMLASLDRLAEARKDLLEMRSLADRSGNLSRLVIAQSGLVGLLFATGLWDDALAESELPEEGVRPDGACIVNGCAAMIGFHRGNTATAGRRIAAGMTQADLLGRRVLAEWTAALALDRELAGHPREALALLTTPTERVPEIEPWLAESVRLATALGETATAREATARAESLLEAAADVARLKGVALHCRGLLNADPALLLDAADQYTTAGRPLPRAQALEAAAALLAAGGDTRARAAFDQAFDGYTGLGAAWDLSRLRAAFRPYGFRRGHGTGIRHDRPVRGWEALTKTERTVAGLVAEGLSNPRIAEQLVLSRRTVEVHVANILRKLEAGSRVELAVAASKRAQAE